MRAQFIKDLSSKDFSGFSGDNYNRNPLHIAAQFNVVDVAAALLSSNMNPHHAAETQRTALHYAAFLGHTKMCEVLLKHGADVNAQTLGGNLPLMTALVRCDDTYKVFLGHKDLEFDIENDKGNTALDLAVMHRHHAAVVDLLLEYGDIINSKNNDGETALCLAAKLEGKDASEMVRVLLQCESIGPRFRDNNGMTALHRAASRGNLEVCRLLGVRVDGGIEQDWKGKKTSQLAESNGHVETVSLLRELEDISSLILCEWGAILTT